MHPIAHTVIDIKYLKKYIKKENKNFYNIYNLSMRVHIIFTVVYIIVYDETCIIILLTELWDHSTRPLLKKLTGYLVSHCNITARIDQIVLVDITKKPLQKSKQLGLIGSHRNQPWSIKLRWLWCTPLKS